MRLKASRAVVCLGLLAGVLLSHRLWYATDRHFPFAPVVPFLGSANAWLDLPLFAVLCVSLVIAAVGFRPPWAVRVALVAIGVAVLLDQSRLQPWVYEYALLLIVLAWPAPGRSDQDAARLHTARAVVVALYFWSAVQKANFTFVTQTWSDVSAGIVAIAPDWTDALLKDGGAVVPVVEALLAVGLLTRRFRRRAIWLAVVVHASILVMLIADGENTVVWPWNVAMPILTMLLFHDSNESGAAFLRGDASFRHITIAVLCLLLPALSLIGWWDDYLSGALYSGNLPQAVVAIRPATLHRLPDAARDNTWQASLPMFIDINRWSYDELNVPVYPAPRALKAIAREICRAYVRPNPGMVGVYSKPGILHGTRSVRSYDCARTNEW